MCNLTIAGVLAAEAGGGVTKNNLTSIAINSQRYKLETPHLQGLAREEQKDNSPSAGEEIQKKQEPIDKTKQGGEEQQEGEKDLLDSQDQPKNEGKVVNAEKNDAVKENSEKPVQGDKAKQREQDPPEQVAHGEQEHRVNQEQHDHEKPDDQVQ